MHKKLSIIVPVYNVESYLMRCMESLYQQDLPEKDYEVIIVNDGSTDRSYDIAKDFSKGRNNMFLYTQTNGGLSAARNTGLKHATGKYIFYVDSDDYIEKNILGRIWSIAEYNQLDICFFKPMVYTNAGRIIKFKRPSYADGNIYSGEFLLIRNKAMTSVWHGFYNRSFLERIGISFYEGLIHEDIHYNLKIFPHAKRIMINDIDGYYYCQNGESIMRTKNVYKIMKSFKSRLFIIKDIKDYSKSNPFSEAVNMYYSKQTNSMLVSALLGIIQNPLLALNDKNDLITFAKSIKVFPIWGKTKSWKTTLLLLIFSLPFTLNILFHFNFLQKEEEQTWS